MQATWGKLLVDGTNVHQILGATVSYDPVVYDASGDVIYESTVGLFWGPHDYNRRRERAGARAGEQRGYLHHLLLAVRNAARLVGAAAQSLVRTTKRLRR